MSSFASLKSFFALRPTNPYLFWAQVGEWPIGVAHVLFFPPSLLISSSFSKEDYCATYYMVLSILSLLGLNNWELRNSCIWITCNVKNSGLCSTYDWSPTLLTGDIKTDHMQYSNYPINWLSLGISPVWFPLIGKELKCVILGIFFSPLKLRIFACWFLLPPTDGVCCFYIWLFSFCWICLTFIRSGISIGRHILHLIFYNIV
jgi:hypothetical protein